MTQPLDPFAPTPEERAAAERVQVWEVGYAMVGTGVPVETPTRWQLTRAIGCAALLPVTFVALLGGGLWLLGWLVSRLLS